MKKNEPIQGTTNGIAAALLDTVFRLATSRNPREQVAGYLIAGGMLIAYLVGIGRL